VGTLRGVANARAGIVAVLGVLATACTTTVVTTPPVATIAPTEAGTAAATSTTAPIVLTTTTLPTFQAETLEIDGATAARMTFSWHEGCPVELEQLRLLRLSYHDFDRNVRTGELVVNADVADNVVAVFSELFDAEFPIERMELIDVYEGDDEASMRADNSSAFNCRYVSGTGTWSEHAYGRAIDINPFLNPWVRGSTVDPPEAERYADRTLQVPGMIHDGDLVVRAFASIGWTWGGTWSSSKDYQHFSSTGR